MAIDKVEKKRAAFTTATVVQLGISAALALAALGFGYFAFANWRFKVSLVEGYRAYDIGNVGQAAPALRGALDWRPDHAGARELLAKIEAESGSLDGAQRHYEALRAKGHNPPQVKVGLGVVHLRRAEKAEDPKEVQAFVAKAREEFKAAAAEAPEGEIGQGHCDLLLHWKLADPKAMEAARATFDRVRKKLDADGVMRARLTREGLVDYYAGLGKVLSVDPSYDPAAVAAWKACAQVSRRWTGPQVGILLMEARRFDPWKGGLEGLQNLKTETTKIRNDASNTFRAQSREIGAPLQEAWLVYTLSLAAAWARAGGVNEYVQLMGDFKNPGAGMAERLEPAIVDAVLRTEMAAVDIPNLVLQETQVRAAIAAYVDLEKKLTGEGEVVKERRALALNNLGWMEAWRGSYTNSKVLLSTAAKRFDEALKLFPDDFVFLRNALVVHKRLGSAAAVTAPLLEKARAAGAGASEKELEELLKHLGAK